MSRATRKQMGANHRGRGAIGGVLLLLVLLAPAQAAETNLALMANGGMPFALASAPNLAYSAQKAADGNLQTAWVAAAGVSPVWWQVGWRFPVTVTGIVILPPATYPEGSGAPERWLLEAQVNEQWQAVGSGQVQTAGAATSEMRLQFAPLSVMALRLTFAPGAGAPVALGEVQVLGPEPVLPLAQAPAWQGRYIWVDPSLSVARREPIRAYLRRTFTLPDPATVQEAWLVALAYDRLQGLWVNNRPALRDMSYHRGTMRPAQVAAIPREWLAAGENVLSAEVHDLTEVGSQGLLAELVLIGTDGRRTIIATDDQWRGHVDQGVTPDWRKPGFKGGGWTPCRVAQSPNGRWQWLWNVAYPTLSPPDTLRLTGLRFDPPRPRPGREATVHLTLECDRTPTRDYAVIVRLGETMLVTNADHELWGAALGPPAVRMSAWQPGRQEVAVRVRVPREAPAPTPASLIISVPEQGAGVQTTLPGLTADAYGVHFKLPVDRGTTALTGSGFPGSEVRDLAGSPTLHIGGQPVSPIIWSQTYDNYRRYAELAPTGVKLFRLRVEGSAIPAPEEEDAWFDWWLGQVDRLVQGAVEVDPQIKLLLTVEMDPHPQWLFDHPAEQMASGRGELVIPLRFDLPDKGQVRPTFMSQDWGRQGARGLQRLVRHLQSRPYAPAIAGICFFAGRAGENYWGINDFNVFINERGEYDAKPREQWSAGDVSMAARRTFRAFLQRKYRTPEALQKAWQRPGLTFDDVLEPARFPAAELVDVLVWARKPEHAGSLRNPLQPGVGSLPMDYYQCFSEAMLDSFATWGRAVKEASGGKLLTGCYYGYTLACLFTSVPGFSGHTAVAEAARCPDLDFFVSPAEYDHSRRAGGHFWGHNIIDGLRLHRKLWLYEQDERTYLAEAGPKTYSRDETIEVLKRNAAASLTHANGWWWHCFGDGQRGARALEWYVDDEIARLATRLKQVYDHSLTLPDRSPSAQIAFFYHGPTHTAQDLFPPTLALNISLGRLTLVNGSQRLGAPSDLYNVADLPELARRGKLSQYKLCIFLNPFYLTPAEQQWLELAKGGGRTLVWLWAPGLAAEGESLSAARVSAVTGMPGIKLLNREAEPTCRLTATHPQLTAGLPAGFELAPRPFAPGSTWERFGNKIGPLPYVDPAAAGPGVQVLGQWVLDGALRQDLAALCVREERQGNQLQYRSVYSAVPYLTPQLMRNLARYAGVHVYREADDILFADRHFVALHTGAKAATDKLTLPAPTTVYDVFADRVLGTNTDRLTLNVPPYSTALYYLGDPAPLRP